MLEKVPVAVGHALNKVRAGADHLISANDLAKAQETITVSSPAFSEGAPIPPRFTADGLGVSPPLIWSGVPSGARAIVLVVEDADSPTPAPIVHLLAWNFGNADMVLPEGVLASPASAGTLGALGMNSFRKPQWLPPDPPSGHGPHAYVFQVYALDYDPRLAESSEKAAVINALREHVLARGRLTGVYERPG